MASYQKRSIRLFPLLVAVMGAAGCNTLLGYESGYAVGDASTVNPGAGGTAGDASVEPGVGGKAGAGGDATVEAETSVEAEAEAEASSPCDGGSQTIGSLDQPCCKPSEPACAGHA
jgi:hypothetical protein